MCASGAPVDECDVRIRCTADKCDVRIRCTGGRMRCVHQVHRWMHAMCASGAPVDECDVRI
eukprot:14147-Chlamydomonas_euryale.AAC.1